MRILMFESFSKDMYYISDIVKYFKSKKVKIDSYSQAVINSISYQKNIYDYVSNQINKLGISAHVVENNGSFKIIINELLKISIHGITSRDKKYIRILYDERFKKDIIDQRDLFNFTFEDIKEFVKFIKKFLTLYPEYSSIKLNDINSKIGVFENFVEKMHELAGAVLILDNSILLVNSKKHKNLPNHWSIPKGHIETDMTEMGTAIEELAQEANIHLPISRFKNAKKDELHYIKNEKKKYLVYFVIQIEKTDIDFKLYNDMILKYYLNKDEISEAGFFSKEDAVELIDKIQLPILKYLK